MLTQKSRYALRALQHLADRYGEQPVRLSAIARAERIPPKFLTVILAELSREGLVGSRRGRDGGYWLQREPASVSYSEIVRLTSGSLALLPCAGRVAYAPCRNCVPEEECRLRLVMLAARDATAAVLDRVTLADPAAALAGLSALAGAHPAPDRAADRADRPRLVAGAAAS